MIQIKRSELKRLAQNKLGDNSLESQNKVLVMISTAMAAHTSYTTVGNEPVKSYEKWIELHDKLIVYDPPHSSPMEHCARAMSDAEYNCYYKGYFPMNGENDNNKKQQGWCYNLKGFISLRYMIDNKNKFW